jgi:hypothetical protein
MDKTAEPVHCGAEQFGVAIVEGNAPPLEGIEDHVGVCVAVGPAAAYPRETRAASQGLKIRLAVAVSAAGMRHSLEHFWRCFVQFSQNSNQDWVATWMLPRMSAGSANGLRTSPRA